MNEQTNGCNNGKCTGLHRYCSCLVYCVRLHEILIAAPLPPLPPPHSYCFARILSLPSWRVYGALAKRPRHAPSMTQGAARQDSKLDAVKGFRLLLSCVHARNELGSGYTTTAQVLASLSSATTTSDEDSCSKAIDHCRFKLLQGVLVKIRKITSEMRSKLPPLYFTAMTTAPLLACSLACTSLVAAWLAGWQTCRQAIVFIVQGDILPSMASSSSTQRWCGCVSIYGSTTAFTTTTHASSKVGQ